MTTVLKIPFTVGSILKTTYFLFLAHLQKHYRLREHKRKKNQVGFFCPLPDVSLFDFDGPFPSSARSKTGLKGVTL